MTDPLPSLGERVAFHRKRRGLSQVELGRLIGRSESWASQVERNTRKADRLSVLAPGLVSSAGVADQRNGSGAVEQDLLHRARAEDVLHWQEHQRPISAETLRKRLRVGAPTARGLVAQLRSDIHTQIEGVAGVTDREPRPTS